MHASAVARWALAGASGALLLSCGRIGFDPVSDRDAIEAGANDGGATTGGVAGSSGGSSSAGGVGPSGGAPAGGGGANGGAPGSGGAATGAGSSANGGAMGSGGAATGGAATVDGGVLPGVESRAAAGFDHSCGVSGTGKLSCWGLNSSMALGGAGGAQSATPVPVVAPAAAAAFAEVAAGNAFACARHDDGRVFCWGDNTRGTLATGDTSVKLAPVAVSLPASAVQLSTKERVACALLADGTLWCWGDNAEGQAGQNEPPPYSDALTPLRVPGSGYTFVSAGQGHVCAIRAPGTLWCWGRNVRAELGQGSTTPVQIRTPVRVGTADDWKMVSAGAFQTCAIRKDDSLWCWGDNGAGQLGLGDTSPRTAPTRVGMANDWMTVSIHAFHACGLRRPGTMWCWGRRDEGAGGFPWASSPVVVPTQSGGATDWVEVASGWMHTCAVRASGTVWCTGENDDGRVGDGTTSRPYAFVQTQPLP